MKNKCSSEGDFQKVEDNRVKRISSNETVALVECAFCGERERYLSKMSRNRNSRQSNSAAEQ